MVGAVGLFVFGQPGARRQGCRECSEGQPVFGNRMEERFRRRFDEPANSSPSLGGIQLILGRRPGMLLVLGLCRR